MLGACDVKYMPQIAIKGYVLADFVVEFTKGTMREEKRVLGVMTTLAMVILLWEVYTDEAINKKKQR